jgi:hypothetical protein
MEWLLIVLLIFSFIGMIATQIIDHKFKKNSQLSKDNLAKISITSDQNIKITHSACSASPIQTIAEVNRMYDITKKANEELWALLNDKYPYSLSINPFKKTLPIPDNLIDQYTLKEDSFYSHDYT